MKSAPARPLCSGVVVALALVYLAGCAAPIGPGYKIQKETLEVRYVAPAPVHLNVRATYRLANTGNRTLNFLDVALPDEKTYGRRDAHARVDGREVTLAATPGEGEEEFRVPFDPPWTQKQHHTLEIEYDLAPDMPGGTQIAVNAEAFHLRSHGWFPDLEEAKGLFAIDVVRPDPAEVTVAVPEGFLLISRGKPAGERRQGAEVEHRYRVRRHDLDPFVIAGKYREQRIQTADGAIIFWTFEPLSNDQAQAAGARLAKTWKLYQSMFEPESKQPGPAWIIETPAILLSRSRQGNGPAATAFPGAVLLNQPAFSLGVGNSDFLDLAEHAMVGTWFGEQVRLRPEAALAMRAGLEGYASMAAAAAQGRAPDRPQEIARLLSDYEESRTQGVEKPLSAMRLTDPWEQRRVGAAKAPLFFFALEDECGQEAMRRGIADVASNLRGEDVGWSDLRAALEGETGKNLAAFFRTWLDHIGIPEEFRSRYQGRS